MASLKIIANDIEIIVDVLDTPSGRALLKAAPFESSANRWGEEIYFSTPVDLPQEADARDLMQLGEIAYWPHGKAVAICWGRTPASQQDEPRLASPCNVWGRTQHDLKPLNKIAAGTTIQVQPVA